MHNHPHEFTKHSVEKIESTQLIDESRIAKIDDTTFTVIRFQNNGKSYSLILKNEKRFPS